RAGAVVAEAVHQRVGVVDAGGLGVGVGERAAGVEVEVVVACAAIQNAHVAQDIRDGRGDQVVLEDAARLMVATAGAAVADETGGLPGAVYVEGVAVDPRV